MKWNMPYIGLVVEHKLYMQRDLFQVSPEQTVSGNSTWKASACHSRDRATKQSKYTILGSIGQLSVKYMSVSQCLGCNTPEVLTKKWITEVI